MLFVMIAVVFVVGADAHFTYHVAMTGLLSAGLVFTTSSVNSLIYQAQPAKEAAAAGFILLSIDSVCSCTSISKFTSTVCVDPPADHMDAILWLAASG
jgi:SHO1 osmosensor